MDKCDHEYFHESTHYSSKESGYSVRNYIRLDIYYCHKCLDKKEVERSERCETGNPPIWWQH